MDAFEEGEQTLIRPDYYHHADLEESGEDFEREEVERTEEATENGKNGIKGQLPTDVHIRITGAHLTWRFVINFGF